MLGDGYLDKSFSVTSEKLADELQVIAHLIGKSASKNIHEKEGNRKNRKTTYRITISDKNEPTIKRKFVKKIKYNDKVYCFSTSTGFFVTRRNGKIAIQGNTLKAQTSVLAAANPKFGRFDPTQGIPQQIDLPPALINRFDVIFTMRDVPNKAHDERVATHILDEHKTVAKQMIIEREIFRKYVAHAKQKVKPKLSEIAIKTMKDFYVGLRNRPMLEGQEMRTIPISARQLNSLIRMAEASAKLRLSEEVTEKDAEKAINLMKYYLEQAGYDEETGQIDLDKISGKIRSSQRNKIYLVRDTINELRNEIGEQIPVEKIEEALKDKMNTDEIEEALERLAKEGNLFRPRHGYVQKT
jgi:replicative DNA helicase Mcm